MKKKIRSRISILAAMGAVLLTGCINVPLSLFGATRGPLSAETVIPAEGLFNRDRILMIALSGVVSIGGVGGLFGGSGMLVELKDRLNAAEKDSRIKAIILRIDTPGGGVTASDLIHHEIMEFKRKKNIPVVAMMLDVAASGGLYIAMAADEIYALPTTVTASIGVITLLPGLEGLSEKIGFEMRVIKSGNNKDLGSPWRSLTDEDREVFQTMIDSMFERFLGIILAGRAKAGLTRQELLQFADGRVITGQRAAELNLIDGVLYMEDVIERTKALAGIQDAALVSYEYPYAYRGNIYASSPGPRPRLLSGELNLFKVDLGLGSLLPSDARFLYMWLP